MGRSWLGFATLYSLPEAFKKVLGLGFRVYVGSPIEGWFLAWGGGDAGRMFGSGGVLPEVVEDKGQRLICSCNCARDHVPRFFGSMVFCLFDSLVCICYKR